jgi:NAD+ synthase
MLGNGGTVIPPRIIDKPPSAELREDQKDEDSLPPYEILDAILYRLIEGDAKIEDIIRAGHDSETVEKVANLLRNSEFKRFQSAPGTKLSPRAFWLERRYPLTNRFRDRLHANEG